MKDKNIQNNNLKKKLMIIIRSMPYFLLITIPSIILISLMCSCISLEINQDIDPSPDHPYIYYYGRIKKEKEKVILGWPGSSIYFKFHGNECKLQFQDKGNNYLKIKIDDQNWITRRPKREINLTPLLSQDKTHKVFIIKKTEGWMGDVWFDGCHLGLSGKLLKLKQPSRRIEFIGDSITAGIIGGFPMKNKFSDSQLTYTFQVAQKLNAEFRLIAWSGMGLVRNSNDPKEKSDITMQQYFLRAMPLSSSPWDFSSWQPQVVVITLGHNDLLKPKVPDEIFSQNYEIFLKKIMKYYPQTDIFACETFYGFYGEALKKLINKLSAEGTKKLHYLDTSDWLDPGDIINGHPTENGHKKIATNLLFQIKKQMTW